MFGAALCRAGMRLRQVRYLQSYRCLLKCCTPRWFTHLTPVPALVLDVLKVLNKRLLLYYIKYYIIYTILYYIIEGSEVHPSLGPCLDRVLVPKSLDSMM